MLTSEQLADLQKQAEEEHRRVGAAAGFLLGLVAGLGLAAVLAIYLFGVW